MDKKLNSEEKFEREILFTRYSNGTATPSEIERIQYLLEHFPDAKEELENIKAAVLLQNKIREIKSVEITSSYKATHRKIKNRQKQLHFRSLFYRIAAILLLPLLISTLTMTYIALNNNSTQEEITYIEITSAPGLISQLELPDNSRVWLNSGSKLRYPSRFTNSIRKVELSGEGYFEVISDMEHPFLVTTESGIKVRAYGTQFNVVSSPERTEAVLAEGNIDILFKGRPLQDLKQGEEALFEVSTNQLAIKQVNVLEKTAWKDGIIIFRNSSLEEVFQRLSRRYNVDIILHDPYNLVDKYEPRVTFTDETIHQIFSYLEAAAPITWKITSPTRSNDSTLTRQTIEVWLNK